MPEMVLGKDLDSTKVDVPQTQGKLYEHECGHSGGIIVSGLSPRHYGTAQSLPAHACHLPGSNGHLVREPLPCFVSLPPSREPSPEPLPMSFTTEQTTEIGNIISTGIAGMKQDLSELIAEIRGKTSSTTVPPAPPPGTSGTSAATTALLMCMPRGPLEHPPQSSTPRLSSLAHRRRVAQPLQILTQQSAPDQTLQFANGQISVVDKALAKAFPDMGALLRSLMAGSSEHGWTLTHGASLFVQHLLQLQKQHTFGSILQYTERFFQFRRAEMLHGHYSGWWVPDNSLIFNFVALPPTTAKSSAPSPASSSTSGKGAKPKADTVCMNFLQGKCPGDTCQYGRQHIRLVVSMAPTPKA
ncbi:hypothetical protein EXIGLDRAFT_692404 [Exidia glandulosa HHB12029]|uniref:C3H1-type domain-containing protein n=1 Tax=Exidia glandulosa HHB12029 TaxID=1314781 RepID=A0A165I1G5_EXIGL|nr:hypothetical protein EXIGLDRAFT_692404 [Exidia glandulosa HHB12029]